MKEARPPRSLASAEASRRNGARSQGPRTALGKLKASQNSRKHGLFRAGLLTGTDIEMPAEDLEGFAERRAPGWLDMADQSQLVAVAKAQLAEATRLLGPMRAELAALLESEEYDSEDLAELLQQIDRMARYQRRFRGKRDRALRRLMMVQPPGA